MVLLGIAVYNGLVGKKVETQNAWSQIDVQLKRRHDLIPNRVETVKGYAGHEKETLEKVVQARNMAVNALSGTLKTLFAVSEAYPDLKANQSFLSLQEELTATENRIGAVPIRSASCCWKRGPTACPISAIAPAASVG